MLMNTGEQAVESKNGLLTTIAEEVRRKGITGPGGKHFCGRCGDPVAAG